MKNKVLIFVALVVTSLSLTACNLLPFFNQEEGGYSYRNIGESENKQSSDISTPLAGDITANKASITYADYVAYNIHPISMTPSTKRTKLLVIPIWFSDSGNYIDISSRDKVRSDINSAYFGKETDTGWQSVKTFYENESGGSLTLTGTVSDWYEVGKNVSYYANDPANNNSGAPKTSALAVSAVDWYFSNHSSESRRNYDCDADGYLDGVMLIYAAPDYTLLGNDSYDNLWAYCYWIQDTNAQSSSNPGANAFFWASYSSMYGSEVVAPRTGKSNTKYGGGDTSHCSIDTHTFIHEMGHMFGLEDYYDYSKNNYSPAGGFSMQDANVGGHDPFSSFALGWGKAYIPTTSITIDLKSFVQSGEMIILSPSWNAGNSAFDEYLIIEYFTAEGLNALDTTYAYMKSARKTYPTGTKNSGIRVWHVDARLLYSRTGEWSANNVTTNPKETGGRVTLMMMNTYYDNTEQSLAYCSPLGASYANYNLLQLIRNDKTATYKSKTYVKDSDLFHMGDTFSMDAYKKQFVNSNKLNSNKSLGFTFTVNACNNTYASITINKA